MIPKVILGYAASISGCAASRRVAPPQQALEGPEGHVSVIRLEAALPKAKLAKAVRGATEAAPVPQPIVALPPEPAPAHGAVDPAHVLGAHKLGEQRVVERLQREAPHGGPIQPVGTVAGHVFEQRAAGHEVVSHPEPLAPPLVGER